MIPEAVRFTWHGYSYREAHEVLQPHNHFWHEETEIEMVRYNGQLVTPRKHCTTKEVREYIEDKHLWVAPDPRRVALRPGGWLVEVEIHPPRDWEAIDRKLDAEGLNF